MEFADFNTNFTVVEVINYLKKHLQVSDGIVDALKVEQVNGKTLIELDDNDLKMIGFCTLGQRKLVQRLIKEHKYTQAPGRIASSIVMSTSTTQDQNSSVFKDLKELIMSDASGQQCITQLEHDGVFNSRNHRKFINLTTDILVKKAVELGFKKNYPSKHLKIEIAKSIISSFPQLKYDRSGMKGYEHFYDPQTFDGYVEYRLKTLRRSMPIDEKAYKKRGVKRSIDGENSTSYDSNTSTDTVDIRDSDEMKLLKQRIVELRSIVPSTGTKTAIYQIIKETFEYRRHEVDVDAPSITTFLAHYPRFVDVDNGALFTTEFAMMFPEAKPLSESFKDGLVDKVFKVAEKKLSTVTDNFKQVKDNNLRALLLLQKLLSQLNIKSTSRQNPVVFEFRGAGTDATNFAAEKEIARSQPFLLAIGDRCCPDQYFLIADFTAISLGSDALDAFFKLFCCFWVCNISYFQKLSPFFNFFEVIVLGRPALCSVGSLLAAMQNVV